MGLRKVYGGTVQRGEALCKSCTNAQVARGEALKEEILHCTEFSRDITFKVTFCSSYIRAGLPSIHEMNKTAWHRIRDKHGDYIFVDYARFQELQRKGLVD